MARPTIRFAVLAGLGLAAGGVAVLVDRLRRIDITGADLMARFEELDSDIAELRQNVSDAARRVEEAVTKLTDQLVLGDVADQQQIEEARAEVRESINALKAIVPAPQAPAEPAPEPGEPA